MRTQAAHVNQIAQARRERMTGQEFGGIARLRQDAKQRIVRFENYPQFAIRQPELLVDSNFRMLRHGEYHACLTMRNGQLGAPEKFRAPVGENHSRMPLGDHIMNCHDGRHRANQREVGINRREEKGVQPMPRHRPRHAQQIDDGATSGSRRGLAGCLAQRNHHRFKARWQIIRGGTFCVHEHQVFVTVVARCQGGQQVARVPAVAAPVGPTAAVNTDA